MLKVKGFTFNPVQENTYIVYNEAKECCIIDPGCYFASEEKELQDFVKSNDLVPVYLLNTHCHLDHIFGNRFIHKKYGLILHLHQLEKQVLDFGPATGQMWQLPFDNYDGELKFIDEKDVIRLGHDVLQILFTPGHSPGHVCFY
ncbi:MAG: MBL fold metallo-hydrolase, partial [Chitinophagaceae bacterium]